MSYAREQLFDGYLRPNMGMIVSTVKVREIVPHLPCLTQTDREEIEAKREISGNYVAMQCLLDCLKRRENWPEQFISALEQCEHGNMASTMRAKYEALLGRRANAAPVAPAANAHPVHIPDPSPPRDPVGSPVHPPRVENLLPQQQPQSVAISGEQDSTPVNNESSVEAAPCQGPAVPTGQGLPRASSPAPAQSCTSLSPSLPQVTLPVQESILPAANGTQQPVENSDQTVYQGAADNQQAHSPQGSSAQQPSRLTRLAAAADHTNRPALAPVAGGLLAEDDFFSKPGTLLSAAPPVHRPSGNPPFPVPAPVPEEPYSGSSSRLEISASCSESVAPGGTGVPSYNEPEEDHYESVNRSLLDHQEVRVNVGHVSEAAPIENHAGQAPPASNDRPSSSPVLTSIPPGSEIEPSVPSCPEQPQSNPQRDQGADFPYNLLYNYYVAAAAVAGLSVLLLWKLKN